MRKLLKNILLFLPLSLLISCASVLLPSKQKITIETGSKDAKIYVNNEKFGEGTTATKKIDKGSVSNVAIVYGDDYVQQNNVLIPMRKKSGGYAACQVLNCLFIPLSGIGLYGLYADSYNSKGHSFPEVNSFKEAPLKKPLRTEDSKYIYLSKISLDIQNAKDQLLWFSGIIKTDLKTAIIETENKSVEEKLKEEKKNKRKKNKKEYLVDENKDIKLENVIFTGELQKVLHEGGYTDTTNSVFIDNNNTLIIEGKINKIDLFRISPNKTFSGGSIFSARTELKWFIKNTYGEIIDSIADLSFSENFASDEDIIKKIVGSSVTQSFYDLMKKNRANQIYKIVKDFDPKLDFSKLNKPNLVVQDKRDAVQASVIIKTKNGHGSGFAITNDGYIVTNYHVLVDRKSGARVDEITVIDFEGNELTGTLVKYNKFRDVALIKVEHEFTKAFMVSDQKSFQIMDDVYTIGAPKSVSLGQSISVGLISNERKFNNNELIQLNMSVNSGNSGGPVFDKNGHLHGVVVSKLVGKNTEGVSFAIPTYKLSKYLNFQF
jgi:S1-C subfamily serine protease